MKDVIVRSQIREIVEAFDEKRKVNIAEEYFQELSRNVKSQIDRSIQRARANQRNTLLARDV